MSGTCVPEACADSTHVYHLFIDRDSAARSPARVLAESGIQTGSTIRSRFICKRRIAISGSVPAHFRRPSARRDSHYPCRCIPS